MKSTTLDVEGLKLHCVTAGSGQPVLLLHGWPMSSHLWRNVIPPIAEHRRVIALDLPGFGRSDKPLDRRYDFAFYHRILNGVLDKLELDRIGLVVHDLGGPVGLYWASQNPERLESLALLNTIVYPELSFAVRAFIWACRIPLLHNVVASPRNLERALHMGIVDKRNLRADAVESLRAPFVTTEARKALLRTGTAMHRSGLESIARWLPTVKVPVRVIYGVQDRILPDIRKTVQRVQNDVPSAQITALEGCGHFLQEERPDELGQMLADFFRAVEPKPGMARP